MKSVIPCIAILIFCWCSASTVLADDYILQVTTCDEAYAESVSPVRFDIVAGGVLHSTYLDKPNYIDRKRNTTDTYYLRFPVTPLQITSARFQIEGTDGWCTSRVYFSEYKSGGVKIVDYTSTLSLSQWNYIGARSLSGTYWLDTDSNIPSFLRFSNSTIDVPADGAHDDTYQLEVHTANTAASATVDPVWIEVKHDGVIDKFLLDNPGTDDRRPGQTDYYNLTRMGLGRIREITSITLSKPGPDGYWAFDRFKIYSLARVIYTMPNTLAWANATQGVQFGNVIMAGDRRSNSEGRIDLPRINLGTCSGRGCTSIEGQISTGGANQQCRGCPAHPTTICWECDEGLACNADGRCVSSGGYKEPCRSREAYHPDASVQLCDSGLTCQDGTCFDFGRVDNPCSTSNFCDSVAGGFSHCIEGTCRLVGTDGERCAPEDPYSPWYKIDGPCVDGLFCINGRCKKPGTDEQWLRGEVGCTLADGDCNICANDVEQQFLDAYPGPWTWTYAAARVKEPSSRSSSLDWATNDWSFNWNHNYDPYGISPGRVFDDDKWVAHTHVQGFIRTYVNEYPYVGTHSDDTTGSLFVIERSGGDVKLAAIHRTDSVHPSGAHLLGTYVFFEDKNRLRWFDMTYPDTRQDEAHFWLDTPVRFDAGGGVGAVKLENGSYLVMGTHPVDDSSERRITDFFYLEGDAVFPSRVRTIGTASFPDSSENTSIVTDCKTGEIYQFRSTGQGAETAADVFENVVDEGNQGTWELHKLEWESGAPVFTPISATITEQDISDCHFRSAATVHVNDKHELEFHCHERNRRQSNLEDWGVGEGDDFRYMRGTRR